MQLLKAARQTFASTYQFRAFGDCGDTVNIWRIAETVLQHAIASNLEPMETRQVLSILCRLFPAKSARLGSDVKAGGRNGGFPKSACQATFVGQILVSFVGFGCRPIFHGNNRVGSEAIANRFFFCHLSVPLLT